MFLWFQQKVVRTFVCSWSRQWPWLFQFMKLSHEQTRPTNWGKTISDLYPYLISDHSSQEKYVSMKSLSDSFLNVMEKLPSLRSKSANTHQIPINFQCWGVLYALSNLDKGEVAAVLYLSCRDWCAGHLHLEKESYMQTPPSYSWLVEGLSTTLVSSRWRIKLAKILWLCLLFLFQKWCRKSWSWDSSQRRKNTCT